MPGSAKLCSTKLAFSRVVKHILALTNLEQESNNN